MKTISIKQPWAYLICSGIKNIENRTWKCPQKYIGQRVLVHASAKSDGGLRLVLNKEKQICVINHPSDAKYMHSEDFVCSAIIGSVEIVDCVFNHPSIWAEKSEGIAVSGHVIDEKKPIIWNWVLANPILFNKPILNVKGKLKFWDYILSKKLNS